MNSLNSSKNSIGSKGDKNELKSNVISPKNELKKPKKPNRNNKNRTGGARKSLTVYVPKTARPGSILPRPVGQGEEDVGLIYLAPFPDSPVRGNVLFKQYPRVEQLFELPNYSNFDLLEASLQLEASASGKEILRQSKKGTEDAIPRSKGIARFG